MSNEESTDMITKLFQNIKKGVFYTLVLSSLLYTVKSRYMKNIPIYRIQMKKYLDSIAFFYVVEKQWVFWYYEPSLSIRATKKSPL